MEGKVTIIFGRRTALASTFAVALSRAAHADDWPSRPVKWIVPYPAGGGSDTFARPIAARLAERFGRPMPIDNRSGAGGTIGTVVAARSPADGYTLLLADTGLVYAPVVYPSADYDFVRDFAPISALARAPYVLAINAKRLDVPTLEAFLEAARKAPGGIDMGSTGLGSITHLAITLLEKRAGVRLNHVPYRGGAPMLQDLLSGQIGAAFVLASTVAGHIEAGRLRGLAIANRRREPMLPDVPTTAEAGLPDFRVTIWFGVFAPRQTPAAILDRLHEGVQAALVDPEIQRLWREQAARVEPEPRAAFVDFVQRESRRWTEIARAANVKLE